MRVIIFLLIPELPLARDMFLNILITLSLFCLSSKAVSFYFFAPNFLALFYLIMFVSYVAQTLAIASDGSFYKIISTDIRKF